MSDPLAPLPDALPEARAALHRVAVHVLARRRQALSGRIGLRATPGGFGTPAAGPDHEVLRVTGSRLVRERTGERATTTSLDLAAATLADAAVFADVDLTVPLDVGHDTPAVGDASVPLGVDAGAAAALGAWFAFGWEVLDASLARLGASATPTVVQLWPEHFDAGCDVAAGPAARVNLGVSPGDADHPEPYVYVGPWGPDRPGDEAYWNAPFGAVLSHADLRRATDPHGRALAFLMEGVERFRPTT